MMRTHRPGQAVFRSVLPEDIDWKPFPAFPPPACLGVVVGRPAGPGRYVIQVTVPAGVKLGAVAEGPDQPRGGHRRRGDSPRMSTATTRSAAMPAPRRRAGKSAR